MTTGLHFLGHLGTFLCWSGPEQALMSIFPSPASTVLTTGWSIHNLNVGVVFSCCVHRPPTTAHSSATTMDCQQQRCDFHS